MKNFLIKSKPVKFFIITIIMLYALATITGISISIVINQLGLLGIFDLSFLVSLGLSLIAIFIFAFYYPKNPKSATSITIFLAFLKIVFTIIYILFIGGMMTKSTPAYFVLFASIFLIGIFEIGFSAYLFKTEE